MRYLPNTPQNQRAMLDTIGVRTVEDLLTRIPAKARLSRPLALLPSGPRLERASRRNGRGIS